MEQHRLRWRIEDWHRILKSGCKVEFLGHRTGERIERAVTINAVIAWRLAAMTLTGRETPELPPDILFSELEISVLEDFALDRKLPPPDNLGLAVLTVAILGGYLNRKESLLARTPEILATLYLPVRRRPNLRNDRPAGSRQQSLPEAAPRLELWVNGSPRQVRSIAWLRSSAGPKRARAFATGCPSALSSVQAGAARTARRFLASRPHATPTRWTGSPRSRYFSA